MTPALEVYNGNYSAYISQREERYARRLAEYETQTAFIEKEQEFIRRNIAGQNTNQAKGRRRRLERLLEESRLAPPPSEPRRMHIHLNTRGRSGDLVLRTHDLEVGYHDEGRRREDDLSQDHPRENTALFREGDPGCQPCDRVFCTSP
jgi:ATP-binding cassette subfamily F protein 3